MTEIYATAYSKDELYNLERQLIKDYDTTNKEKGYNTLDGGDKIYYSDFDIIVKNKIDKNYRHNRNVLNWIIKFTSEIKKYNIIEDKVYDDLFNRHGEILIKPKHTNEFKLKSHKNKLNQEHKYLAYKIVTTGKISICKYCGKIIRKGKVCGECANDKELMVKFNKNKDRFDYIYNKKTSCLLGNIEKEIASIL